MSARVLIVNGPGLRDLSRCNGWQDKPMTLADIEADCTALAETLELSLDFRHTEDQDELSGWLAQESARFDGFIINPAGPAPADSRASESYVAALNRLARLKKPVVEVRLANIYRPAAAATALPHRPVGDMALVCGFGRYGYLLALKGLARNLAAPSGATPDGD